MIKSAYFVGRFYRPILSDDEKSADFCMSHNRFYRPILSADISPINLAVELVLILRRKSADKIGPGLYSAKCIFGGLWRFLSANTTTHVDIPTDSNPSSNVTNLINPMAWTPQIASAKLFHSRVQVQILPEIMFGVVSP